MNDFTNLAIMGAVVSYLSQYLKNRFGTSGYYTQGIVLVLSLVGGLAYYFAKQNVSFMQAALQIIVSAGAVYSFILSRFDQTTAPVSSPPSLDGKVVDEKTGKEVKPAVKDTFGKMSGN